VHVEPDDFARDTWSRGPLLSTAEQLASSYDLRGSSQSFSSYEDLFSLAAVDELLSRRGLRTPFIRLAKDGVVVPPGRYTRSGGTGAQVADQVADDRVLELFLDGHTIVLQGLHRLWPPLIDFAGALSTDLGHPVQVNAYITPSSSQGFSAHYDVHDVFVLQVAGEKRWRIHRPVHPDPLRDQPWTDHRAAVAARAQEEPVIDTVLRPGDALYLPRGHLHAAEALGDVSCHLTVGVHPVTRHAVLETLLDLVADEPALRTSLPLGVEVSDPASLAAEFEATVTALVDRLLTVTPADVSDRLAGRLVSSNRPGPVSPLAQATALRALSADSVLVVRPDQRHVLRIERDLLQLRLFDRTVALPLAAEKAVRALLDGERLRVRDLPDLGPDDSMSLARRLVREAVVVVDDGP